jgi:hypothetical protein
MAKAEGKTRLTARPKGTAACGGSLSCHRKPQRHKEHKEPIKFFVLFVSHFLENEKSKTELNEFSIE